MPNYDFKCDECGTTFSENLSMGNYDEEIQNVVCVKCKSQYVERNFKNSKVTFTPVFTGYTHHDGTYLSTQRELNAWEKENNLVRLSNREGLEEAHIQKKNVKRATKRRIRKKAEKLIAKIVEK